MTADFILMTACAAVLFGIAACLFSLAVWLWRHKDE